MSRGGGRQRRGELRRRAEKVLRRAPRRRPGEGGGEYAERLRPWFLGLARADADEVWPEILEVISERGAGAPPAEIEPWVALARRFVRREGGSVHATDPALELLARHGFPLEVAIYKHFEGAGIGGDTTTYLPVGESSPQEMIATAYVPDRDAVTIWRAGEAPGEQDFR